MKQSAEMSGSDSLVFHHNRGQHWPRFSRRAAIGASGLAAASISAGGMSYARELAFAAAVQQTGDAQELTLPFNPFGQPIVLDPHRAPNWGPFWVLFPHLWTGLLAFDENGGVITDLAESVEPNDKGDIWTCTIRDGITFGSGNAVTADAFIASWKRALDPERRAPMSTFMSDVKGYSAYVSGESSEIGFAAIDDRTIEITLQGPSSSFPASLATFVWAAVDLGVTNQSTPDTFAGPPAGAGAWQVTEFVEGERIVMMPNSNVNDLVSPSISRIVWRIFDGPNATRAILDAYMANEIAIADVPGSSFQSVSADSALASELKTVDSSASTMAIGMDFNQEPFNDVRVRRALAASIDVERWANEVWEGEFAPATGCVPPVVSVTSGYEPVAPLPFDPDTSARLLDDAAYNPDDASTEIVYYQPANDSPLTIERHRQLLAMIEEASGIIIRQDTSLTREQIESLRADNRGSQFDIVWWWTVTDTPAILGTIGRSDSPNMANHFNWSAEESETVSPEMTEASAQFDAYIDDATASLDPDERNTAYQEAESLIIENAVYVPLGHWVQRFLQKPWLKGTRQGAWTGSIPVRFDADVVIDGKP